MIRLLSRHRLVAVAVAVGALALLGAGCASKTPAPSAGSVCSTEPDNERALSCSVRELERVSTRAAEDHRRSFAEKLMAGDSNSWERLGQVAVSVPVLLAGAAVIRRRAPRRNLSDVQSPPGSVPSQPEPEPVNPTPTPPPPPLPSLVGTRIRYAGTVCVIVDDSQPSVALARASGGRAAVTAADGNGAQGVLFLGFDAAGDVREAATESSAWAPAVVVH